MYPTATQATFTVLDAPAGAANIIRHDRAQGKANHLIHGLAFPALLWVRSTNAPTAISLAASQILATNIMVPTATTDMPSMLVQ